MAGQGSEGHSSEGHSSEGHTLCFQRFREIALSLTR